MNKKIVLPVPPPDWTPPRTKEPVGDITTKLLALASRAVERRKALEAAAARLPADPCPHGNTHTIDIDESSRRSTGHDKYEFVWTQCQQCQKEGSRSMLDFLSKAGAPKNLLGATLDNWKPVTRSDYATIKAVRDYVRNPEGMLIMFGPVGTGKTHLAVAIMRELKIGRLITQAGILEKIRARYNDPYAENIIVKLRRLKLAVIDELGLSSGGKDELPELYKIINHYYAEEKSLIITTNEPPDVWPSVWEPRIADRLSVARIVEFTGASKRRPRISG